MNVLSRSLLFALVVMPLTFHQSPAQAQRLLVETPPKAKPIPEITGVWGRRPSDQNQEKRLWIQRLKNEGDFEMSFNEGADWHPIHWSPQNERFEGTSIRPRNDGGKSTTTFELKVADNQHWLELKMRSPADAGGYGYVTYELDHLRISKEVPQSTRQPSDTKSQSPPAWALIERPWTAPENLSQVASEPAAEIKVFTLANGDAADYVKLLRAIFPDVRLQADSRTNQIIAVFKKPESGQMLEALLLRLDETKTPKGSSRLQNGNDPRQTRSPQELVSAIDGQEQRAVTLAQRIRQLGPKHPDFTKSREELNTALQSALDLKFQQEQLQLQQLEERLSRLQQQLTLRQAASSKIVERRAQELLDGDLKWNPDSPGSPKPSDLTNPRAESKPASAPLFPTNTLFPTHTEVKFEEPAGQLWSVDGTQVTIPFSYSFERDRKKIGSYKIQLLPEADGEPTISGVVSIFPLDIPQQSLREFASIPLKLTYEERRKLRLGNHLTFVYYIRRYDGKLWLETPVWTGIEPGVDPIAEARREGTVIAAIDFKGLPDRGDPQAQGDPRHAKWDPKIHVDVYSGPDLKLDPKVQHNLIASLTGVAAVSISESPSPKGNALTATVRDPLGICRQESREETVSITRVEIEHALREAGVKEIRWDESPKADSRSAIPANHTQVRFTGPEAMEASIEPGANPLTVPGVYNFKRTDTVQQYDLRLYADKTILIDIYPTDDITSAFLETNAVPFQVTDEDVQQLRELKSFTKIVYLVEYRSEPNQQKLETLLSSRLDPGLDPFAEARRRGPIVAAFRFAARQDPQATSELDLMAAWVWKELRFKAKPVTDPTLVPASFRGGLQITEISSFAQSMQKGDILIGAGIWETLSLNNVLFAVEQQETQSDRNRPNGPKPLVLYLLRDGELVVTRQSVRSLDLPRKLGISPGSSMSLDQCIDLLQRKQVSNDSLGVLEMMRRIVELANAASPKDRHQVAMALFLKGETLDPISETDGPLYNEIIQLLQKIPDADLLPLQIEILQTGGPARTQLALYSLKKLRDYTSIPDFPALVEELWKLSRNEDRLRQMAVHRLVADTLPLTNMKPEEFSTEERRQMVARLIDYVPHQKVIDLLSSALQSHEIDVALQAAQLLKNQPEDRQPEIVQRKLQLFINVLKGQLGEAKASREQRAMALLLLGGLGSQAAPAVPTLVELLQNDEPDLKADEAEADKLVPGRGLPAFTGERIVSVLGTIGPGASAALPVLEARLKLAEQQEREEAILSPDPKNRRFRSTTSAGLKLAINRITGERDR